MIDGSRLRPDRRPDVGRVTDEADAEARYVDHLAGDRDHARLSGLQRRRSTAPKAPRR